MANFVVSESKKGNFSWRLVDAEGETSVKSPRSFEGADEARSDLAAQRGAVRGFDPEADGGFEVYENGDGHRWRFKDSGGDTLAYSAGSFPDAEAARADVERYKRTAGTALVAVQQRVEK